MGQKQDVWIRFYDSTTEQSGYKDLKGIIKIPAKFESFTRADTFYQIIAVNEKLDSLYTSYYLLKNGKKVGQDSVYSFDFTFDCESEGKIIFYDRKSDRVGFFDNNGVPIIPAIYNHVSPFHNGLALAHRNAKRTCWGEDGDTTDCEHSVWKGGETILINEKNEVLAEKLDINLNSINLYSKTENASFVDTSIYISIKGTSNKTYSFIDFNKEFEKWFNNTFLPSTREKNGALRDLLFTKVTYGSTRNGWTSLDKNEFFKLFPRALTPERFQAKKTELSISEERIGSFRMEGELFAKYYNACGEPNRYKYPVFDVVLTNYKNGSQFHVNYREHFLFLRTQEGYKLFQVSLKR